MASAALFTSVLLALSLLSIGADARPGVHFYPCKTLFISYTVSSSSSSSAADPAALHVSQISASDDQNHFGSFAVYRIIRPLRIFYRSDLSFPEIRRPISIERPVVPSQPAAFGMSSLQERAKDILFVVVGLLFGVGCGALTAATIYLAWSLVANRHDMCCAADDDFEEDSADESPKKMGYVKITDLAPVKEGYEGN